MIVICCGTPDRGDEAAGPLVARALHVREVPAREHSGEALSLIEQWRGEGEVILVQAVVTGAPPGTVSVWDCRTDLLQGRWFRRSSRSLGIAEAVGIARNMGRLPRRLIVYGIEARRFEPRSKPTAAVLDGVEEAARQIAQDYELCTSPSSLRT